MFASNTFLAKLPYYVMDPISALSLAATIIQVVDFGSKIVSKGYHLNKSATGVLDENEALEIVAADLRQLNAKLKRHDLISCSTQDEHYLDELSSACIQVTEELLTQLSKLKVPRDCKHRKWKSFRQALKSVWGKEDLNAMAARLAGYRRQLQFHVLLSLKENNDLLAVQQTERFDRLDDLSKDFIRSLHDDRSIFSNEMKSQNVVLAELSQQTQSHVTKQHEETRLYFKKTLEEVIPTDATDTKTQGLFARLDVNLNPDRIREFEDYILASLAFPSMHDRYEAIEDAHRKTFNWIFEGRILESKSVNDFSRWLTQGDGTYWIKGKPGSGKSTLMRYIYEDSRTSEMLEQWAGSSKNLVVAGFFFWKSGVEDQASQLGLVRSLLYEILRQRRGLILKLFPQSSPEWETFQQRLRARSDGLTFPRQYRWSLRRVKIVFRDLFLQPIGYVCLFIDGLDEYEGDHLDTVSLLKETVSATTKLCVSSRPWVEFEEAFQGGESLRLQDLSHDDIRLYVKNKLADNAQMQELCAEDPVEAPKLVDEICLKAQGVFLWVKLVVRSLIDGLTNGDHILDLQSRLREFASELETFYAHMLANIQPRYFEKGSRIFQMWDASRKNGTPSTGWDQRRLPALMVASILDSDGEVALKHPIRSLSSAKIAQLLARSDKRVKVCCACLMEVSGPPLSGRREQKVGVQLADAEAVAVDYIHRTAKEFIDSPTVWDRVLAATINTGFDATRSLAHSYLLRLKISSNFGLDEENVASTLLYCASRLEEESVQFKLLDELERTLAHLRPRPSSFPRYRNDNSYREFCEKWPADFTRIAQKHDLLSYVAMKEAQSGLVRGAEGSISQLHRFVLDTMRNSWDFTDLSLLEETAIVIFKRTKAEHISEAWIAALEKLAKIKHNLQRSPDRDNWRFILVELFLRYGADPTISIGQPSAGRYTASEIIHDAFSATYPQQSIWLDSLVQYHIARLRKTREGGYLTQCQRLLRNAIPWGSEVTSVGPRPDLGDYVEIEECADRNSHSRIASDRRIPRTIASERRIESERIAPWRIESERGIECQMRIESEREIKIERKIESERRIESESGSESDSDLKSFPRASINDYLARHRERYGAPEHKEEDLNIEDSW